QVARRRVDRLRHPRGGTIAPAIVRRAQVRAALHHLARDPDVRRAGIEALLARTAARIVDRATGLLDLSVVLIPVGRPLPNIAGHLVEAVAVRREGADWRRPLIAVFDEVLPWERALPCVGHRLPARHALV